jgi:ABC-type sugar transport system permease subunit
MERFTYKPGKKDRELLFAILLYCVPTLALIAVFQLLPIYKALEYGFYKINLMSGRKTFVGLANYIAALHDQRFLGSLATTFRYFLMRVPIQVVAGFLLAVLIVKPRPWTAFMRTAILLPVVTSMVVATAILGLMMHPSNGLFNSILALFGFSPLRFLTSPDQALPSIVFITVWKNVGMTMLFFLAGMMAISPSLYEAADIDGASFWRKHVSVTIPLLRKTFAFVLTTTTIRAFQVFGPVLMATGGGPSDATRVVVMDIYENAFVFNQMGYASALSMILTAALIAVSLAQLRMTAGRKERAV